MMKPSSARASDTATVLVPAILLLAFCLVPFADGIARMLSGDGVSGLLQQDMRAQIASLMSSRVLVLAALSVATAVLCIVLAVPLTYLLTSASRAWRTLWLSMLVVVLSFSLMGGSSPVLLPSAATPWPSRG